MKRIGKWLCGHGWHAWTWDGAVTDETGTIMVCKRCGEPAHPVAR